MIYFTSDLHLGHRGIVTMQNRPFQTVDEMNRILIQNFNACVNKGDTVYILGDICHHMPIEAANDAISSLHGKKYLIKGNHDKKYEEELFEEICDFKVASLNGETIALMHYPMMSWPKSRRGSIHLHGHIHADQNYSHMNKEQGIKRYDVGVDANNFMPISIKRILQFYSEDN